MMSFVQPSNAVTVGLHGVFVCVRVVRGNVLAWLTMWVLDLYY